MAELLFTDGLASAHHDVCERCEDVFHLAEGCTCKVCGWKHWHDEICWSMRDRERQRHLVGDITHTRGGLAVAIAGFIQAQEPSLSAAQVVVGVAGTVRNHVVQVWVRDLTKPREELVSREGLAAFLEKRIAFELPFEVIAPPPWEYLG